MTSSGGPGGDGGPFLPQAARPHQREQQRGFMTVPVRHRAASRATLAGAVPPGWCGTRPGLDRQHGEHICGERRSAACISASVRSVESTPFASADATSVPVTWCASRNGSFRHDQPVGKIGRGCEARAGKLAHRARIWRHVAHHPAIAASDSAQASAASNTGSLSSCMSLA